MKGTGEKSEALLTSRDVFARYGIASPRLSQLVARGLPVAGRVKGRGRPAFMFRAADIDTWIAANSKLGREDLVADEAFEKRVDAALDESRVAPETWRAAIERQRKGTRIAYERYLVAQKSRNILETRSCLKIWQECTLTLTKMEAEASKIEQAKRETISRAEHERIYTESHTKAAYEWRSFAKKVAPLVAPLRTSEKCLEVISAEVEAMLRRLAESLAQLKESEV